MAISEKYRKILEAWMVEAEYGNTIAEYERDMWNVVPDLWFQMLYKTFHLEFELAFNLGRMSNVNNSDIAVE